METSRVACAQAADQICNRFQEDYNRSERITHCATLRIASDCHPNADCLIADYNRERDNLEMARFWKSRIDTIENLNDDPVMKQLRNILFTKVNVCVEEDLWRSEAACASLRTTQRNYAEHHGMQLREVTKTMLATSPEGFEFWLQQNVSDVDRVDFRIKVLK